ncbi:hypothetical protein B0H12DRAFT_1079453 [Mycena haematopus]|nr:hypothetical protein B0H12DRAFT_1079453 [Mycena haematopus]
MPGWAATPELTTRTLGGFLLDAGPLATTNTAWGAPSWGAGAGSWGAGAGSWGAGAGSWGVPTTGATVLGVASTSPAYSQNTRQSEAPPSSPKTCTGTAGTGCAGAGEVSNGVSGLGRTEAQGCQ